jgi:O-antigen/teichoic acid export membrane protein
MRAAVSSLNSQLLRWSCSERTGIAVRGGIWSMVGYVSVQLLRTGTTLVLARHFLGPELFGIIGLVGVFLTGLSMFSEIGIVTNIVQHPRGDDPDFLNTAFSIQAARGSAIWIISLLAAYPMAVIYEQPQLLPLLAIGGLSEMVRGLTSTAAWTLQRHVRLRNITLLLIGSEALAFVISVLWALVSPSAWALIARTLTAAVLYALGSHFIAKPAIRFGWDLSAARDILHFGGWISLGTATYFLSSQGERLLLGKLVTPAELGCFSLAIMLIAVPGAGISQLLSQIFLPMISAAVRTTREGTVQDFLRVRQICFTIGLAAAVGFLVLGKPFVSLLLNPKYHMTGWMLQILGLRLALDVFAAPLSNLILAFGLTKYSAAGNTMRLIGMVSGVSIAFTLYGLWHAVMALIVAQVLSYFPLVVGIKKVLPEVAAAELRWYAVFLVLLALAFIIAWPRT